MLIRLPLLLYLFYPHHPWLVGRYMHTYLYLNSFSVGSKNTVLQLGGGGGGGTYYVTKEGCDNSSGTVESLIYLLPDTHTHTYPNKPSTNCQWGVVCSCIAALSIPPSVPFPFHRSTYRLRSGTPTDDSTTDKSSPFTWRRQWHWESGPRTMEKLW